MYTFLQNVRRGLRAMRTRPIITIVAPGLVIGVGVAILSTAGPSPTTPLPEAEPMPVVQLFQVDEKNNKDVAELPSFSKFDLVRESAESFENVAAYSRKTLTLTGGGEPEVVKGELVSAGYFPVLRVQALKGRVFSGEDDETTDASQVAVISYSLWQRRFGADPDIAEKRLTLDGKSYAIIGVLPEEFNGQQDDSEVWLPLIMSVSPLSSPTAIPAPPLLDGSAGESPSERKPEGGQEYPEWQ